jgi:hypothetical protein
MLLLRTGMGVLLLATFALGCKVAAPGTHTPDKKQIFKNFINWNGEFRTEIDSLKRKQVVNEITGQIAAVSIEPVDGVKSYKGKLTSYIRKEAKNQKVDLRTLKINKITVRYCSTHDPLLWNVIAEAEGERTDTADGSTTTVVPPKPTTRPAGDPLAILDENKMIMLHLDRIDPIVPDAPLQFHSETIEDSAVIAVLDTGIDTMLFSAGMRTEILWHGAAGSRNMVANEDPAQYIDQHPTRHGTSVAGLALNSYYKASDSTKLPKLMVLKVMDRTGSGTIFELCCGLSYAADHNATVINTSMGYYGTPNDILNFYAAKCSRKNIPIVAAAGNDTLDRVQGQECSEVRNDHNMLSAPDHLFYPACLANDRNSYSVISVTGFATPGVPCHYQNYSDNFVTIGVMNETTETHCCVYQLPFINSLLGLEGTSFATPIITGKVGFQISRMGRNSLGEYIRRMQPQNAPGTPAVTQNNQYITY